MNFTETGGEPMCSGSESSTGVI